jgi:GTPase
MRRARHIRREDEYGMIEYKLKLSDISKERRERLKTQMMYRLYEGEGRMVYNVGWCDNGYPKGIKYETMLDSLGVIYGITEEMGVKVKTVNIKRGIEGYCSIIYLTKEGICNDILPIWEEKVMN